MDIVYHKESFVTNKFDDKNKIILVEWKKLSGHPYLRECISMHVDLVKNKKAKALIIDVSQASGVPSQEDQAWFGSYVFPEYEKFGLKLIVTILPSSALTEMSAKKWNQTASSFKFKTFETDSITHAMTLVQTELNIQ